MIVAKQGLHVKSHATCSAWPRCARGGDICHGGVGQDQEHRRLKRVTRRCHLVPRHHAPHYADQPTGWYVWAWRLRARSCRGPSMNCLHPWSDSGSASRALGVSTAGMTRGSAAEAEDARLVAGDTRERRGRPGRAGG